MKIRVGFIGLKGGVGKTTIALNSALYLSKRYKVLYIDKDLLSMGSLILGFNGLGFHKAIIEGLGKEQYEYKVNDNLTLFKLYSDPVNERELHNKVKEMGERAERAYVDVVSKGYDVIIIDYGRIFRTNDPLVYDEYEMFKKNFSDYLIGGVGITDPVKNDITDAVEYFLDTINRLKTKPLAFVINMVPQIGDIQKEIDQLVREISEVVKCDIITIPFNEELVQYNKLGEFGEMQKVGKLIEKILSQA
ncbi:AAA family ATPase [Sulfolobus sp. E5-1-F]|uniref:ParA family protein n=1 Tax=Saccharolobus sp. E5-1-F TaxID=2663019 RepID=UPI001297A2BC|nr:ParA family protein [Sulfolobus sp. E5-1-F]QGA53853.1 AAA family ATPase [Sulfolobus sp. E5-1-F]